MELATGGIVRPSVSVTLEPGERVIPLGRREPTPVYDAMCRDRGWLPPITIHIDGLTVASAIARIKSRGLL